MKYKWEEDDIRGGRYVCYESYPKDTKDIGGLSTVVFQFAYSPKSNGKLFLISIVDGSSTLPYLPKDWIDRLNGESGYGYRPCSKKELLSVINYNIDRSTGI
jgi:hypothetical protein